MIASYGGLITSKGGGRNYPGSAGYIGGFSIPETANYAKIGGAGDAYHVFIPVQQNIIPGPNDNPECLPGQICGGTGGGGTGGGGGGTGGCGGPNGEQCPTDPPTTGGGGTGGGGTGRGTGGGTVFTPPWSPVQPATIWNTIQSLLTPSPRTSVNANGPAYLFTPQAPAGVTNGIPPIYLAIVAGAGVIGYFLYKRMKYG